MEAQKVITLNAVFLSGLLVVILLATGIFAIGYAVGSESTVVPRLVSLYKLNNYPERFVSNSRETITAGFLHASSANVFDKNTTVYIMTSDSGDLGLIQPVRFVVLFTGNQPNYNGNRS